ncbi:hypothetical protein R2R70_02385 [Cobetia sp. SIMBA_158]|uniref:hypothetical protein n=1 Tax=Cobetia sp. SIMBA_158 TaxID=3081617 RepID=UPI00397F786F
MEIPTHTELTTIFPSFVMHKHWDMPEGFNERLTELAIEDALKNRITEEAGERNIGDTSNHLGHLRHNFLTDCRAPEVAMLTRMVDSAVREYLMLAYGYQHEGEIRMMGDALWQRRSHGENIGVSTHTHLKADIVVTYYPRVDLDGESENALRRGGVRFYDPANVGKRFWPCNNPSYYTGGWFQVEPRVGSMTVFEGHIPHDSTFFEGEGRMCIPIMVDVDTPKKHCKVTTSDILSFQGQISK